MSTSGSYEFDGSQREVDRLAAQARIGWDKEARTLSWFGLQDGMSVLELGSGPGFVTNQLLELLPTSSLTCLEMNPDMLKQAEHYVGAPAKARVRFVQGSVMDIQLADNTFDFAYARLLFQHLADPVGAAKQVWRVLKPGGKLVIYDIDDAIFGMMDPDVPEYGLVLDKTARAQASRGGNRHVGRTLWRTLKAAHFVNLDLETVAAHSDDIGIEPFLPQIDPSRLLPLIQAGLMTDQEAESLRSARERFLTSPDPYVLSLSLMVCGQKPGSAQ